jgi:hypothetical protein
MATGALPDDSRKTDDEMLRLALEAGSRLFQWRLTRSSREQGRRQFQFFG